MLLLHIQQFDVHLEMPNIVQVHTYIAPTWCEVCHHFLWGLKHQGMRCKDCGMDVHKQCLALTIQLECYPNKQCIKRGKGEFTPALCSSKSGVHNAKAEECTTPYMRQNIKIKFKLAWVGYRMCKQFTSYLLPFPMNTNTSETT